MHTHLLEYTLRIADDSMILGQRLSEWCGHGPILEEDIALTNIALDFIGQATNLYEYAATLDTANRSADDFAFLRLERDYKNVLLVEQKNGDYAHTMARQFFFDAFRKLFFERLTQSTDVQLAAIAEKSLKETKYHLKHSAEWIIRMGDGTAESHTRIQTAIDYLWKFKGELFDMDEVEQSLLADGIAVDTASFQAEYDAYIAAILSEATLAIPSNTWQQRGGRKGLHTEHLGFLLAEMQYMQRAYPGMQW